MAAGILPLLLAISNAAPPSVVEQAFNNFSAEFLYDDTTAKISDTTKFFHEYDFIVIGSGTGGSVMANRLTENFNWNVLLLEAGEEENFLLSVPLAAALNTETDYNWKYSAEPQTTACVGLPNGVCPMPRGRGLGGTSLLNYMAYTRGHQRDFDEWEQAGNYGWSYEEVLPYFEKGECSYIKTFSNPYETPLLNRFTQAVNEIGFCKIDPMEKVQLGVYKTRSTIYNGKRYSAARAYLHPIRNRRNLHISMKSHVTKILINPETQSAYGVEFVKNGVFYQVRAKKEVILSAGSIASPQILMLSGIGPRKHLQSMSIPVIKSLDVGHNLHDHVGYSGLNFRLNQPVTIDPNETTANQFEEYITNGTGPFSIPFGVEALSFIKTSNSAHPSDYPDIEIVLISVSVNEEDSDVCLKHLGLLQSLRNTSVAKNPAKDTFMLLPILMHPKSRGKVLLRSKNPFHYPRLEANYFDHPEDLKTFVEGLKIAAKLGESHQFSTYGSMLDRTPLPGCQQFNFASDDYWKCSIRMQSSGSHHMSGTCKMGPASDQSAVVNPMLQVHGISNLRVVDASIFPAPITGHPNAVLFMIGEKAADMVKRSWLFEDPYRYAFKDCTRKRSRK